MGFGGAALGVRWGRGERFWGWSVGVGVSGSLVAHFSSSVRRKGGNAKVSSMPGSSTRPHSMMASAEERARSSSYLREGEGRGEKGRGRERG